jgi:hypothetical protein
MSAPVEPAREISLTLRYSVDYKQKAILPQCEKNLKKMLYAPGLSCFRHQNKFVKWVLPLGANIGILGACFSPLWYPSYYPNQTEVWVADICIVWVVHCYMLFLQSKWDISSCFEQIEIPRWTNIITLTFYWLFILYWAYYGVVMFMIHNVSSVLVQLGNTYMSIAWFFFFTTSASLYYFICAKLLQRSECVKWWLVKITRDHPSVDQFYIDYNEHCKRIRRFGAHWNFVVFLGFILLGFHIPIDIVSIVYDKNYYDAPGAVIKGLALSWYLYCICRLDDLEGKIIPFLYKNRMFVLEDIQMIEKYVEYRGVGLDFYGIRINTGYIMKVVLIVGNLIVPTLYAVLKNNLIK